MDYNIKSKELYDDISNYSTVTTDTITISEGLYEENYLFNVTCESLAGITSTNQKNLYVEITSNPNPEVLRPSNYESANDVPVQIQTQIITDFCSYSLEKNPTLADFTRLETEDNLIHTGSISDLQQGENTLKYICQGDGSTYRHDFTIDRTRPSLVNITSEDITCGFEDVQVLFDAQDNISGIQRYLYEVQIPDEDTEEFNTTNSRNYIDLNSRMQDKTITIRSRAQNGAGLLSQGFSSKEILVTNSSIPQCDNQPPLAIVSDMFNEEQNAWEVSVECQDDIGCKNQFNYGLTYGQECVYDNSAQTGTILEFSESIRFCYAVYDQNNNNDTGFIDLQIDYAPHCFNEIQDADETGVDCGGSCDSCEVGNSCEIDEDCDTNFCSENICVVATCTDEVQNQDETGVDCGGSCPGCQLQSQCQADSDCLSNNCQNNICQEPSCENNITDGSETDVDCGGSECQSCELTRMCLQDSDCQSNYCEDNICKTPTTSQPGLDSEQEQDQDLQLPSQNEEDISLQ
jgi:hypothetical protein